MSALPPTAEENSSVARVPATAVIVSLLVFDFVNGIMQGEVTPLLPDIRAQLQTGTADLNWIVSVELLAAAISVPVFGRLGDLYGHRRMLRIAIVGLAVGSILVTVAPSMPIMLAGRVLQGTESALAVLVIALCRDLLPVERSRTAIAWIAGALPAGILVGALLVGGLSKSVHSVHWVLAVPTVLAVLCIPLSYTRVLPWSPPRGSGRMDWVGAAGLAVSMAAVLLGVSAAERHGWGSGRTIVPIVLGLLALAGWALFERRVRQPLVDLTELLDRRMLPVLGCTFIFGVFYFGNQAADATFLSSHARITGYGFGFDAMGISLLSIPLVGAAVLAALLTTRVAARLGGFQRATTLGFVLVGVGYVLVAGYHGAVWIFVVSHLIAGFGGGLAVAAMPVLVAEATRPERIGVAIGLYTNSRAIGGAVGAAAAASVLSAIQLPGIATAHARQPVPSEHAYVVLWSIIAVITFLGAGIAASTRRTD
ncbi:MFS transporter [Nocardia sp. NPDC088792]|uniref:MFS transporter n=1 Tax=Nocardia sp. NPDC088792 TaxID=3364332 RepID=UPI0038014A57